MVERHRGNPRSVKVILFFLLTNRGLFSTGIHKSRHFDLTEVHCLPCPISEYLSEVCHDIPSHVISHSTRSRRPTQFFDSITLDLTLILPWHQWSDSVTGDGFHGKSHGNRVTRTKSSKDVISGTVMTVTLVGYWLGTTYTWPGDWTRILYHTGPVYRSCILRRSWYRGGKLCRCSRMTTSLKERERDDDVN